jgi:hypothetical protein
MNFFDPLFFIGLGLHLDALHQRELALLFITVVFAGYNEERRRALSFYLTRPPWSPGMPGRM